MHITESYFNFLRETHHKLGIDPAWPQTHHFTLQHEPELLIFAEFDCYGRIQRMEQHALHAWQKMKAAAAQDKITLNMISAFRSVREQIVIFEKKLQRGIPIAEILAVNAPPGYSEHHTGQAIDILDEKHLDLTRDFEKSAAFAWLQKNANQFSFYLSFPKDNPFGIYYEPWHWKFCS